MAIEQPEINIPSDPAVRDELRKAIKDQVDQLIIIQAHKDALKEAASEIAKKYDLPKKYVSKMIRTEYRDNFNAQQGENDQFSHLYEVVMKPDQE